MAKKAPSKKKKSAAADRPIPDFFDEDGDVSAIRAGYVSVTPLHLDLTHEATRRKLAQQFGPQSGQA